jgi:predicted amidohydrolase YtcJ
MDILWPWALEKLEGLKNSRTEFVDLNGGTVLPGFIDAHLHEQRDPDRWDLDSVSSLL